MINKTTILTHTGHIEGHGMGLKNRTASVKQHTTAPEQQQQNTT